MNAAVGVPRSMGWIAFDDGVTAFALGNLEQDDKREVFYLDVLCVRPDKQGTGVGSRLLDHLKDELENRGVKLIYLITHRGPPENFYEKNGYRVSDEDVVMIYEW